MNIAYSYIRFSSAQQAKGSSLRRQTEATERYCKFNHLELDTSLTLRDLGVSGFRGKNISNGALGVFLEAVKTGRVKKGSVLIVENLDRLTRADVLTAQELFIGILRSGIEIVTLMDSRRYSAASVTANPAELMVSISVMARAHEESQTKSIRSKDSWQRRLAKAKEGKDVLTTRCPDWLRWNPETKKFEFIPERVAIMKRIHKGVLEGVGGSRMAILLNREKLKWKGKPFNYWLIRNLTSSRSLIGEAVIKNENPIANYYPAVITSEQFFGLQNIINKRTRSNFGKRDAGVLNLFGSILVDENDNPMGVRCHNRLPNGGYAHRLISLTGMETGNWQGYSYETFEEYFLIFLKEVTFNTVSTLDRTDELNGRLSEIKNRINKVKSGLTGKNFDADLVEVLKSLTAQRIELQSELEKEQGNKSIQTSNDIGNLLIQIKAAKDLETKNALRLKLRENISRLIKKITIFIKSRSGKSVRVLFAVVELINGENRTFSVEAQVGKQCRGGGSISSYKDKLTAAEIKAKVKSVWHDKSFEPTKDVEALHLHLMGLPLNQARKNLTLPPLRKK